MRLRFITLCVMILLKSFFKYKMYLIPFIDYMGTNVLSIESHSISPSGEYIPRGKTVLYTILDNHFNDFVENYESRYAKECGLYSLERISSVVEEYLKCGSEMQIVAFVMDPEQIDRIMQHLLNKAGRSRASLHSAAPVLPCTMGVSCYCYYTISCYLIQFFSLFLSYRKKYVCL